MKLPPPILVQELPDWQLCLKDLSHQTQLAVDTESNSLYAYHEQVCLIQISTPDQDYLIDPLSLPHLDGLGVIMSDPGVEKIFHAAEYDLLCLKRDFHFSFDNLFDTMLAARILGWQQIGLASILKQEFDVRLNKRHQRANWGRRPLPPELIDYARLDTHYLPALRDCLMCELESARRLEEARDSFDQITAVTPSPRVFDPDDFWGLLNGHQMLNPRQTAVLRELYILRDREARRRNQPHFKILGNRTLVELAEALPQRPDELQGIHGLTPRVIRRYGRRIIQSIEQGMRAQPPQPPARQPRPPESVRLRYDALNDWRKQRAADRRVESDVIVGKRALWDMARQDPKTSADLSAINSLSEWQRNEYGQELLNLLSKIRKGR